MSIAMSHAINLTFLLILMNISRFLLRDIAQK